MKTRNLLRLISN